MDWLSEHATVIAAIVSAIAAAFIAWFTVILTGATSGQLRELKRSVDTQVAIELPFVFVNKIELRMYSYLPLTGGPPDYNRVIDNSIPPPNVKLQITFKNYGRTPARATDFSLVYTITAELPPSSPFIRQNRITLNTGTIIGADKEISGEQFDKTITITTDEENLLLKEEASLWVYGILWYQDFLDTTQHTRFCFRWRREDIDSTDSPSRFFEEGPEAYRKSN